MLKDQYMGECELTLPHDLKEGATTITVPVVAGPKYAKEKVSGSLMFKLKLHGPLPTGSTTEKIVGMKREKRGEKKEGATTITVPSLLGPSTQRKKSLEV